MTGCKYSILWDYVCAITEGSYNLLSWLHQSFLSSGLYVSFESTENQSKSNQIGLKNDISIKQLNSPVDGTTACIIIFSRNPQLQFLSFILKYLFFTRAIHIYTTLIIDQMVLLEPNWRLLRNLIVQFTSNFVRNTF